MSQPRPRLFSRPAPEPRKPHRDTPLAGERPAEDPLRQYTNASIVAVLLFVVLVIVLVARTLYAPVG